MSEWNTVKLADAPLEILDGDRGKNYPSQDEFSDYGYCLFLSTKNVRTIGFDFSECQFISKERDELLRKGRLQRNDVVLTTRGTVGNLGFFNHKVGYEKIRINSGMVIIRPDESKLFPAFNFYTFRKLQSDFLTFTSGSAQPQLPIRDLKEIEVSIPPLEEQKAIASVLCSLDDKIDLLHRQNTTLERMAETLFRQWFVEEAQEDWEERPIGDLVKVIDNRGKTPPYTDIPSTYPLIEVNALTGNNRLVDYSVIRKFVDEQTYKTWFRGHPKKYDSLLSTVGSIGEISMFLVEKGSIAQNIIALSAVNICPIYLFEALKYIKDEIKELDIGSVQPSIKVPHLLSLKIKIPSEGKVNNFSTIIKSQLEKMIVNYHQIQTLEKFRDNLLPKLMSGEIRLS